LPFSVARSYFSIPEPCNSWRTIEPVTIGPIPKEIKLAQIVAGHLPRPDANILEVGCGEGTNLSFLHSISPDARLVGIDFSQDKIEFAQTKNDFEFVCGNALALPFPDQSFSVVLCRDILHHINWDRDGVVREAIRVAKTDGTVVFFEASGKTVLNRIFMFLFPIERGMRDSSVESLQALGLRHGKAVVKPIEASMIIRALGFVFGPPGKFPRNLLHPLYRMALVWERLMALFAPKHYWAYLMLTLRH